MEYSQLNHANLETRFLKLMRRPKDSTAPMRFELVVASLSNAPEYSSLSYCWGTDGDQCPVEINKKRVLFRRNLAEALYSCGLQEGELIWADAVSINQADLHEKNYQVRLMGQIYSQAMRTYVWLGPAHPCTSYSATLLRRCKQMGSRDVDNSDNSNPFQYILDQALKDHQSAPKALRGLHDLLSRPYWERIWIVQEVAKARDVHVHCGKHRFDLLTLFYASTVQSGRISRRKIDLITTIGRFRTQEQMQTGGNSRMTLPQALLETRNSSATDSRDKIYALLGLTCDGTDLVPTPTYTQPASEVFQKLTFAITGSRLVTNTVLLSHRVPLIDSKGQSWGVDWSDLSWAPAWVTTRSVPAAETSEYWRLDTFSGRPQLFTGATCLGIVQSVSSADSRFPSRAREEKEDHNAPLRVMRKACDEIFAKFATHVSVASAQRSDLRGALARMIRDADKGFSEHAEYYSFSRLRTTLLQLGRVVLDGYPLWHWAREYNQRVPISKVNTVAFRLLETALDGIDGPPEFRLQFAVVGNEQLALVHPRVQRRDEVYQIDQCQLPIALRSQGDDADDHYMVIGEACLRKHVNGSWYSAKRLRQGQHRETFKRQRIHIALGIIDDTKH